MQPFIFLDKILKTILLKTIKLYQATLSPDTGWFKHKHPAGFCRFQPHCSEYAYQAINKYGSLLGTLKTIKRLLRCHPWAKGGHDPIN